MVLMESAIYAVFFGLFTCGEAAGVATSVQLHRHTIKSTTKKSSDVHSLDKVYTSSQVDLRGFPHTRRVGTIRAHKSAYFGTVEIGAQRQSFDVVFDSGSGNLVLPASDCVTDACLLHHRYNQTESLSSRRVTCNASDPEMQDEASLHFGTAEIIGRCVDDQICIGAACYRGSFIAASYESPFFTSFDYDGVLGLGLSQLSQRGSEFSAVERLKATEKLHHTMFAVFLSREDSSVEVSEITFGSFKTSHMESDLHWVPISRASGYWEVKIDDITIDNHPQDLCANCFVALDTGTTDLAGPSRIIEALSQRLNVEPDCSNLDHLPRLGFLVNGQTLNLEPKEYIDDDAIDGCQMALMSLDIPPPQDPMFIFGIRFLEKFYTVYDNVNSRIGFAVAKHASNVSSLHPSLILSQLDASVRSGEGARRQRDHGASKGFLRK